MTINEKLNTLKESIPKVPSHMKSRVIENVEISKPKEKSKFKVPKLVFSMLSIVIVALIVTFVSIRGTGNYSVSDGYSGASFGGNEDMVFNGYTAISVDKAKQKVNETVKFTFGVGHDSRPFRESNVETYVLEVFAYSKGSLRPEGDGAKLDSLNPLYSSEINVEDFESDRYLISNKGPIWVWSKIQFKHEFTLDVDFSRINISDGKIAIRLTQIVDCDPSMAAKERHVYKILRFEKKGEEIVFRNN